MENYKFSQPLEESALLSLLKLRLATLIEVRRHTRAIDIALAGEIEHLKEQMQPGECCGHPECDQMRRCQRKEAFPADRPLTAMKP